MLEMCAEIGSPVLLACSSTSRHATGDLDVIARDLRKLAMLGIPLGVKIAYEGLSWGRSVNEFTTSWDVVCRADTSNLGIGLDSFHILAAKTPLDALELIDRDKIFLVQRSEEHTSELQSPCNLVCRLLLEKKKYKPCRLPASSPKPAGLLASSSALSAAQHPIHPLITAPTLQLPHAPAAAAASAPLRVLSS